MRVLFNATRQIPAIASFSDDRIARWPLVAKGHRAYRVRDQDAPRLWLEVTARNKLFLVRKEVGAPRPSKRSAPAYWRAQLPEHCDAAVLLRPQPRSKAMLCPVCWSEQNNASALHEQRAQVAIAALADAPKDRPVTCRHLPHRRVLALIFSSDIIHWRRCGTSWPRIWPGRLLLFLMAAVAAELRGRRRCARARELTVRGLLAAIAAVSDSVLASRVFAVCKSARPKPSVNVPYIGASRSRASD